MAYSTPEIRSFDGLYLQANSFQVPDGAMERASRVVIKSDQIISKTYGFYEYWRPSPSDEREDLLAHFTYQGHVIGVFANGAGYYTDTFPFGAIFNSVGVLTTLNGAPFTGKVNSEFIETAKNLYWTANEWVMKLERFDGKVRKAGVPPGLGIDALSSYQASGILPFNSQTAYRGVFGRRDENGNLLLGAPSDVVTVGVPAPFENLSYSAASGVVTVQWPGVGDLGLYAGADIMVGSATDPDIDGVVVLTDVDELSETVEFSASVPDGTGTLTIYLNVKPIIVADVPSEIDDVNDEYFFQLYRTSSSDAVTGTPEPDFALAAEVTLTQADIDNRSISVVDDVALELLGAQLYTNPNTREGELQQNTRPPKANYIELYKGYMLYADIVSVQRLILNFVNPPTPEEEIGLIFKQGLKAERYQAIGGSSPYVPGNVFPRANLSASGTTTIVISFGSHTFPLGSVIKITDVVGTLPAGKYTMTARTSTTMTIVGPVGATATQLTAQVISDGISFLFNGYSLATTPAQHAANYTRALVACINANSDFMYANYQSQFDDFPGKFMVQSKDIGEPIFIRTSAPRTPPIFVQNVPSSFSSGIQCFSESDILPNQILVSKFSEPEAVPVVNAFPVGSANFPILAIHTLRDCVIILKGDGVYKLVGDTIDQFNVTMIDSTVSIYSGMARPSSEINNTVMAMSNQGVLQISDTSAQVVSRRIEDVIQPLFGRDLSKTFLFGHETDRLFYIQTENHNPGEDRVTWIYNVVNQTWTSTTDVFDYASIGSQNQVYGSRWDTLLEKNTLWRQRRTNTRVDWCNEYAVGDIQIDPLDKYTGLFSITGGNLVVPEVGDVILHQNVFNRIIEVELVGADYKLTFAQQSPIPFDAPVEVTLYKAFESVIKMAPFHAGLVGRWKHYAQMQIHLRQQVLTNLQIDFSGAYYGSSEITDWSSLNISTSGANGWGFSPWGLFPWGLVDGANLVAGTEPANIIRTYIPRFAARNTFIQPVMRHKQAAQPMLIQAISYAVHAYGERVSK